MTHTRLAWVSFELKLIGAYSDSGLFWIFRIKIFRKVHLWSTWLKMGIHMKWNKQNIPWRNFGLILVEQEVTVKLSDNLFRLDSETQSLSKVYFRSYAWNIICHTYWCRRLPLFFSLAFISSWFYRRKIKISGSNLDI